MRQNNQTPLLGESKLALSIEERDLFVSGYLRVSEPQYACHSRLVHTIGLVRFLMDQKLYLLPAIR